MSLGRPSLAIPRVYKALMEDASLNQAYVRRAIDSEELFDLFVSESEDGQLWLRLQVWLKALCESLGLDWETGLAASPTFLEFRSVTQHTDGVLKPHKLREDIAPRLREEEFFYVNLQLRGAGELQVNREELQWDAEHNAFRAEHKWAGFRVEKGDLYTFDQRLDHAWVSDGDVQCKIFSFALPKSAIMALAKTRAVQTGQSLDERQIYTFRN